MTADTDRDLASAGIGLMASPTEAAQAAAKSLRRGYQWADVDDATALVVIGGDGFMLQTLHSMLEAGQSKPLFGMNRGTIGFLMNEWRPSGLADRMANAKAIRIAPLVMRATTILSRGASRWRIRRRRRGRASRRSARATVE